MKIIITIKDKKEPSYKKLHLFLVENDYDYKEEDGSTIINKNEDFYTGGGFLGGTDDWKI